MYTDSVMRDFSIGTPGSSNFACALAFFICLSERFSNGGCMRLSSLAENLLAPINTQYLSL